MTAPTVLILAAGEGTRMRSAVPKVLHPLCGRTMIEWPIAAAREAGAGRIVVVDGPKRALAEALPEDVEVAIQEEPNGTGDAVRSAADQIDAGATVLVLYGDVPLITADAITALARAHEESGAAATMATMELEDPSGYGRVVRDAEGGVERVVETKTPGDATPEEEAIREVNTGIYAFAGGDLLEALKELRADNAQGELYLPDVLPLLRAEGKAIGAHVVTDPALTLGVNTRVELAHVRRLAQERIHRAHALAGVTIVDPASTLIEVGVEIGRDTIVEPGTFLRGATRIGARCEVGPLTTLIDTAAGDDTRIVHSYLARRRARQRRLSSARSPTCARRRGCATRRRPARSWRSRTARSARARRCRTSPTSGTRTSAPGSNIGAGTITANYDGANKHRTTIGARVRVSVHTSFVAPVKIGDGAYTGAGSVITDDVPPDALGIARERQRNIEGYAERAPRKER